MSAFLCSVDYVTSTCIKLKFLLHEAYHFSADSIFNASVQAGPNVLLTRPRGKALNRSCYCMGL